jgi:hypothetical protein
MERRVGWMAIALTTTCMIALTWTWALTPWPMFDYWVVPSLLPTYPGLIGLAGAVALWLLVQRFAGIRSATIILGLIVVFAGLGLGVSPLTAGGSRGWCKSVIGNAGHHGDEREDCFDARASRAGDVAIVVTLGLLITAAGCGPFAKRDPTVGTGEREPFRA